MNIFLLAATVPLLLSATYQDQHQKDVAIVIAVKPPTFSQWTKRVSRQLENAIRYPNAIILGTTQAGVSTIRFHCDMDGKPIGITIYRKSNSREYDRSAMQAIKRMRTLNPVPSSFHPDQNYQANIIFAALAYDRDQILKAIKKDEIKRLAQYGPENDVVALSNRLQAPARTSL